jgi:hypothetical protein
MMNDKELNELASAIISGPIQVISDAAWNKRRSALAAATVAAKGEIVALIQRVEMMSVNVSGLVAGPCITCKHAVSASLLCPKECGDQHSFNKWEETSVNITPEGEK